MNTIIIYTLFTFIVIMEGSVLELLPHYVMHKPKLAKTPIVGRFLFKPIIHDHGNHHVVYNKNHLVCSGSDVHRESHRDHDNSCFRVTQFLWVGFVLLVLGILPFMAIDYLTSFKYNFTVVSAVAFYSYYMLYEIFHNAFHRSNSWQAQVSPKWIMKIYSRRHSIHHTKHAGKNLTNVLPFADYIFGTEHGASAKSIMSCRMFACATIAVFLILVTVESFV